MTGRLTDICIPIPRAAFAAENAPMLLEWIETWGLFSGTPCIISNSRLTTYSPTPDMVVKAGLIVGVQQNYWPRLGMFCKVDQFIKFLSTQPSYFVLDCLQRKN